MANPFGLTDAQVERQLDKLQSVLFDAVEDIPDSDEYSAVVKDEVLKLFLKQFPTENQDQPLTEDIFKTRLANLGKSLVDYINEATESSINEKLMLFFLSDFISQIMGSIFNVYSEEEYDPMFG